jgi:ribose transport system substrate-binding protein
MSLADSTFARMVQMYYKHPLQALRVLYSSSCLAVLPSAGSKLCERNAIMTSAPALRSRLGKTLLASLFFLILSACHRTSNTIAVIPRACGTALWEPEHAGIAHVARHKGMNLYWNAPTREDDVAGQIDLLEKVAARDYAGIIITPDQTLPLRSPIRRLVSRGLPIVVVGTDLGIAPTAKLSYVLNDDVAGGQMAARRVGEVLGGQGSIAILGINPQLTGITARERSFEDTLEKEYPKIRVVARRLGYYSVPQEQQVAEDILNRGEAVNAIVALSHVSTRGAFYALVEFDEARAIKLVGFDQDLMPPIRTGGIDSVIMESTYDMGRTAMEILDGQVHGRPVPGISVVPPILMTRENIDSPEIRRQMMANWWASQ